MNENELLINYLYFHLFIYNKKILKYLKKKKFLTFTFEKKIIYINFFILI
jgi:hypothetical protein